VRLSDRRNAGFTLVEVMIALVVSTLLFFVGSKLVLDSQNNSLKTERRGRLSVAITEFEKIANMLVKAMNPLNFDPRFSYLRNGTMPAPAGATNSAVGLNWGPTTSPTPWSSVPEVHFRVPEITGPAVYSSRRKSHDLDFYCLDQNARVAVKAIYMSRCVPTTWLPSVRANLTPTAVALNALSRPFLTATGDFQCCKQDQATGARSGCVDQTQEVPTVFVYRGDGNVSILPADSDRDVLAGLGFIVSFQVDAAKIPVDMTLSTLWVQNNCQIGRKGKWPCKIPLQLQAGPEILDQTERKVSHQSVVFASGMATGTAMALQGCVSAP